MRGSGALVIVTTSFPILGDGSEAAGSFVSDMAEELARHATVRIVAPGRSSVTEQWRCNIEVFRFAAPDRPLSSLRPWIPADVAKIRRVLAAGAESTLEAVRAGPTSHILALWALPSGHWARRAAKSHGVPYSVWTLGSDIWSLGRIPLLRTYLGRVLHDAHRCYSDGRELSAATQRIAGREVEFLPSTRRIDRRRWTAVRTCPPYRLLFLGRWHPNKGIDMLLDALKQLSEQDWQRISAVEICGGGPLRAQVEEAVLALRSTGRPVESRGFLDKPAAEAAILRADYLVIPSRVESIPVVFSDAVKLGCPVIATPVGDLPELILADPACGLVADAISSTAIAGSISHALGCAAGDFSAGLDRASSLFDLGLVAARLVHSLLSPDDAIG